MTGAVGIALFEERQRLFRSWVWVLAGMVTGVLVPPALVSLTRASSDLFWPAAGGGAVACLVIGLLYFVELTVRVEPGFLVIRYRPLLRKRITLSDIARFEPRTYRPVLEYGGWGIRWSPFGHGWAYNVSGNQGVQLHLTNGKKILIGSQDPGALADAIARARAA